MELSDKFPAAGKMQVTYDDPENGRQQLYGSRMTQHIVQGFCRDLLCHILGQCEKAGIEIVFHLHDEIIAQVVAREATQKLTEFKAIAETLPPWAIGLPLVTKPFITRRFSKKPLFC